MKKIFIIFAMVAAMVTAASCDPKNETPATLQWNVEAMVQGQGKVVVGFPTGNFTAEGDAVISACSVNDSTVNCVIPDSLNFRTVLADPEAYSAEEVELANNINSAFKIEVLEGTWEASLQGYVKFDKIYLIVDERYPRTEE